MAIVTSYNFVCRKLAHGQSRRHRKIFSSYLFVAYSTGVSTWELTNYIEKIRVRPVFLFIYLTFRGFVSLVEVRLLSSAFVRAEVLWLKLRRPKCLYIIGAVSERELRTLPNLKIIESLSSQMILTLPTIVIYSRKKIDSFFCCAKIFPNSCVSFEF